MAAIEKEQVITNYTGKLYSRLFGYMKPYMGKFITALIMVLVVSAVSLYDRPDGVSGVSPGIEMSLISDKG